MCFCVCFFFFFKQKTAYEMRISDWSSDVCSSDLGAGVVAVRGRRGPGAPAVAVAAVVRTGLRAPDRTAARGRGMDRGRRRGGRPRSIRSEEHTSELQSLMRHSYAVFCLKKKNKHTTRPILRTYLDYVVFQYNLCARNDNSTRNN